MPPIRRVSDGPHRFVVRLYRLANRGTGLGIPDSNSSVIRSGDDVPSIGRMSDTPHRISMPMERLTNCSTRQPSRTGVGRRFSNHH